MHSLQNELAIKCLPLHYRRLKPISWFPIHGINKLFLFLRTNAAAASVDLSSATLPSFDKAAAAAAAAAAGEISRLALPNDGRSEKERQSRFAHRSPLPLAS
jgi:hypothetical protein